MSNVVGSSPSRVLQAEASEAREINATRSPVDDLVHTPSRLTS